MSVFLDSLSSALVLESFALAVSFLIVIISS
jgi:hypothetical protein